MRRERPGYVGGALSGSVDVRADTAVRSSSSNDPSKPGLCSTGSSLRLMTCREAHQHRLMFALNRGAIYERTIRTRSRTRRPPVGPLAGCLDSGRLGGGARAAVLS